MAPTKNTLTQAALSTISFLMTVALVTFVLASLPACSLIKNWDTDSTLFTSSLAAAYTALDARTERVNDLSQDLNISLESIMAVREKIERMRLQLDEATVLRALYLNTDKEHLAMDIVNDVLMGVSRLDVDISNLHFDAEAVRLRGAEV